MQQVLIFTKKYKNEIIVGVVVYIVLILRSLY